MKETYRMTEKVVGLLKAARFQGICTVLLAFAMLTALPAKAQQYLGTISGTVTDASGAKVANALITVQNTDTNFVTKSKSNASGAYTIPFCRLVRIP